MSKKYFTGLVEDPPDSRDFALSSYLPPPDPLGKPLPDTYEIPYLSPVRDQGSKGACVAFGSVVGMKNSQEGWGCGVIVHGEEIMVNPDLSPLFLYQLCKKVDGIPNQDGTYIRVAMKILQSTGVCQENCCKYATTGSVTPCPDWKEQADHYKIKTYAKVPADFEEVKRAIFTFNGVVAGLHTNLSWSRTRSGIINYLGKNKRRGGHCIFFVGWNCTYLKFKNSWGTGWGDDGYGYITKDYLESEMISAYTAVDM